MKSFRDMVLEGTNATITVFDGKLYKTSYLQYGAAQAGKELVGMYNDPKSAAKLVTGSGEIRDIFKLEFYNNRNILGVTKSVEKAIKNSNEAHIKYYFDGEAWYEYRGQIQEFKQMDII